MWFSARCNTGPFFSSESNDIYILFYIYFTYVYYIIILFIYNFISLSTGLIENNKEKRGVETDKTSFDCKIRCAHCPDYITGPRIFTNLWKILRYAKIS